MEKILVVASSADHLELEGNRRTPTGAYLNELAVPALRFIGAGYEVVVATPSGKKPVIDERSKKIVHFDNDRQKLQAALNFVETYPGMQRPISLKEAASHVNDYVAIFIPGGHAPMSDLAQDPDLGRILDALHRMGKPTAALCHGPVALLAALPNASAYKKALIVGDREAAKEAARDWIYGGYRMTVFSADEEKLVEKNTFKGRVQFYVDDALGGAGGKIENAPKFEPLVLRDRELITGQNPPSAPGVADALLKALAETKSRAVA